MEWGSFYSYGNLESKQKRLFRVLGGFKVRVENKTLSFRDYIELLKYIEENHSFIMGKGKRIKYITTTMDTRTNRIFSIEFRVFGSSLPIKFHSADTPKGKTFKQWIYKWLEEIKCNGS